MHQHMKTHCDPAFVAESSFRATRWVAFHDLNDRNCIGITLDSQVCREFIISYFIAVAFSRRHNALCRVCSTVSSD